MTDHTHTQYVAGCYRCDLSRDEVASGYVTAAMIEQGRKAREGHYLRVSPVSCTCGWRSDTYVEADGLPRFEAHLVDLALTAVLPGVIRQAKAEAWGEGHAAGCADPYAKYGECGCGPNPYREGAES